MSHIDICVIGIDGGASSVRAAVLDKDLNVLAQGMGGPGDHFSPVGGKERLRRSLGEAVSVPQDYLSRNPRMSLQAVCLGLAGVNIPGKRQAAAGILDELFPRVPAIIEADIVTAWAGAHSGKDGVVVVSGTGSVAYGRNGDLEARRGGFGYLLGDEGSGFKIALAAISAALHEVDDLGPRTALTSAIPGFFGVQSIRQVAGKVYAEDLPVHQIAALCPLIAKEALAGDSEAKRILSEAGRDLGRLAASTLRGLAGPDGLRDTGPGSAPSLRAPAGTGESPGIPLVQAVLSGPVHGAVPVSYAGGVFQAGELLLASFRDQVRSEAPGSAIVEPAFSPMIGAGIRAWATVIHDR